MQPLFFDNKDVQPIFNNKQILMPLKDPTNPRQVQMVLQVINDEKEDETTARKNLNSSPFGGGGGGANNPNNQSN